jgi:hypothetical protein
MSVSLNLFNMGEAPEAWFSGFLLVDPSKFDRNSENNWINSSRVPWLQKKCDILGVEYNNGKPVKANLVSQLHAFLLRKAQKDPFRQRYAWFEGPDSPPVSPHRSSEDGARPAAG